MKNFTRIFSLTFLVFSLQLIGTTAKCSGSVTSAALVKAQVQGDKEKTTATLDAYPNPSRGQITFTLTKATGDNYKVRISNAIGRVVKTIDMNKTTAETRVQADLSDLPSGFYFYSLLANDKMIETKRIILQP